MDAVYRALECTCLFPVLSVVDCTVTLLAAMEVESCYAYVVSSVNE
jgi:hypothetical protein